MKEKCLWNGEDFVLPIGKPFTDEVVAWKDQEIVYFELNNWMPGDHYPDEEPFKTWIGNDLNIYFNSEDWVKENKLCVVREIIDISVNFCVAATKEWIKRNCPRLLTEHGKFLRYPDENGEVYGQWETPFLEYKEENIGIQEFYYDED